MALTRFAKLIQEAGMELPTSMTAKGLKEAGISPRDFIQQADAAVSQTGQTQPGELVTQFEFLFDQSKGKKDETKQASALKKLLGAEKKTAAKQTEGGDGTAVKSDGGDMVNATDTSGVTDTTDIGDLPVASDVNIASLTPEALRNLTESGTADKAIDDYLTELAERSKRSALTGDLTAQFIVSKEQANLPPELKQRMIELGEVANQELDAGTAETVNAIEDNPEVVFDAVQNQQQTPDSVQERGDLDNEPVETNNFGQTAFEAMQQYRPDAIEEMSNYASIEDMQNFAFDDMDQLVDEVYNARGINFDNFDWLEQTNNPQEYGLAAKDADMPALAEQPPDLTEGDFAETGGSEDLTQALADAVAEEGNQNVDAADNPLAALTGETPATTTSDGGGNLPATPPPPALTGTGGTPASGGNPNATASGQNVAARSTSGSQAAQTSQAAPQIGGFSFNTNQPSAVQATPSIQQMLANLAGTQTPSPAAATPTPAAATASPGMSNAQTASLQNLFGVKPTTPAQGTSAAQMASLQKLFGVNQPNQKSSSGSSPGSPPPSPDSTDPPMKDFDPRVNYPFTTGSIEKRAKSQGVPYDPIEQVPEDTKTAKRLPRVPDEVNMGGMGYITRPADAAYRNRVPLGALGAAAGGGALIRALSGGGEEQVPAERIIDAGDYEQRLEESAQRFSDKFYDIMH